MAVERTPGGAALLWQNYAANTPCVRSTDINRFYRLYRPQRAVDPCRSNRARVSGTDASGGAAVFGIHDCGVVVAPTAAALIDANFATAVSTWALLGADDAALTMNLITYRFMPMRAARDARGVQVHYLDTPTAGTMGAGRRFWCWNVGGAEATAYDTDGDAFLELGTFWIGPHIVMAEGTARVSDEDQSERVVMRGGTTYDDAVPARAKIDIDFAHLTFDQSWILKNALRTAGANPVIVDLRPEAAAAATRDEYSFYAELSERALFNLELVGGGNQSIGLTLEELTE